MSDSKKTNSFVKLAEQRNSLATTVMVAFMTLAAGGGAGSFFSSNGLSEDLDQVGENVQELTTEQARTRVEVLGRLDRLTDQIARQDEELEELKARLRAEHEDHEARLRALEGR